MSRSKAFIFSADAFVSFTLVLVTVYALIFFSSVPSAYYGALSQAHFLSRDLTYSLSNSVCTDPCLYGASNTIMEAILFKAQTNDAKVGLITTYVGTRVPNQFGYRFEISDSGTWTKIYDTADDPADSHNKLQNKLSASSQIVIIQSTGTISPPASPYAYKTCNGRNGQSGANICATPVTTNDVGRAATKAARLTVYS